MPEILYSATKDDLYHPGRRGAFFPNGRPSGEAALCAELCRLAYSRTEPTFHFDRPTITSVLERIGFTAAFVESATTPDGCGTHALFAHHSDPDPTKQLTVVAFRGTDADDLRNIIDDANFFKVRWDAGGFVHRGFKAALDGVLENVNAALANVSGRLVMTGHSLGAAMATLLASRHRPDALYTFGSPRVGDAEFVATLARVNGRRYVDCCDAVTLVPPPLLAQPPFAHFGDPWYIDRNRQIMSNPSDGQMAVDRTAAAAAYAVREALRPGNVPVRALADHAPINYVSAVSADSQQP